MYYILLYKNKMHILVKLKSLFNNGFNFGKSFGLLFLALSCCIFVAMQLNSFHRIQQIRKLSEDGSNANFAQQQYQRRLALIETNKAVDHYLKFILDNFNINQKTDPQLGSDEYSKLDRVYSFSKYEELPFCIILQTLNFSDASFEYSLNSIFAQNYTNYRAIIATSETDQIKLSEYLKKQQISERHALNVVTFPNSSILENIHEWSRSKCGKDSVIMILEGNNELVGKHVLKIFNSAYKSNSVGLIYSNFYRYDRGGKIHQGYNYKYEPSQLASIRKQPFFLSASVTFLNEHLLQIDVQDLKFKNGSFLDSAFDQALLYPIVEMLCDRALKIEGNFILAKSSSRNYQEFLRSLAEKEEASKEIRRKKAYTCSKEMQFIAECSVQMDFQARDYLGSTPELQLISRNRKQKDGFVKIDPQPINFEPIEKQILLRKLYPNQYLYQLRLNYEKERCGIVNSWSNEDNNQLIKYNFYLSAETDRYQKRDEASENLQLLQRLPERQYTTEVPMCIVVHDFPSDFHRSETMLNSIFAQNYTNFFAVLTNRDPSKDEFIRKYLFYNGINTDRYVYMEDYETKGPVEIVRNAIRNFCSPDSYSVVLDGSGQILGKNVFKVYNVFIQKMSVNFLYSNGFLYSQSEETYRYLSASNYNSNELGNNLFREVYKRYEQVLAFKTELFLSIKDEDLKDSAGRFYYTNLDDLIYNPILEMSCKKIAKITGLSYILHSDLKNKAPYSSELYHKIQKFKQYRCLDDLELQISNTTTSQQPQLLAIGEKRRQSPGTKQAPAKADPLNLSLVSQGKRVQEYLYDNEKIIVRRNQYQRYRENFLSSIDLQDNQGEIKFNLKFRRDPQQQEKLKQEEQKITQLFYVPSSSKSQIPLCIIADQFSFRITNVYRFQYTLNSIFAQNYTNYFVVIFNDGSETGDYLLRKYLHFNKIPLNRFAYVANKQGSFGLENVYDAVHNYCSEDSMAIYVSGKDELISKNVFKDVSQARIKHENPIIYSNYYRMSIEERRLSYGQTSAYSQAEIAEHKFRSLPSKFGLFFSFHSQLFRQLKLTDLKDSSSNFFRQAIHRAMMIPMLELSCLPPLKIPGVHYLQNELFSSDSEAEISKINSKQPYKCNPDLKYPK